MLDGWREQPERALLRVPRCTAGLLGASSGAGLGRPASRARCSGRRTRWLPRSKPARPALSPTVQEALA
eukprot:11146188-Ditylum_brightwellii.AAC.1